jgi:DNA-binding MarR family transcriptional regulator
MEHKDILAKQSFIFGNLFALSNKLQIIGDRILGEFTTKQWFLAAVITQLGDSPPTLSEVAEVIGSSRQNVKQIALKLVEKGFLRIEKDERDNRVLRLMLTEKCHSYWEHRQVEDNRFITELFADLSTEEVDTMYQTINKLHQKILNIIAQSQLKNEE